jgi:hypothetical protein
MNEKTYEKDLIESVLCITGLIVAIIVMAFWSGAVTYTPEPDPIQVTIEPVTTITQEPTQSPTPEPTPYIYQEFAPGFRYKGELFSWKRMNVQGEKDMYISTVVYGHKELPYYNWYSEQYQKQFPEYPEDGNKFLIVYVTQWMQGDTIQSDPSLWGFNWSHFAVSYQGQKYDVDKYYEPSIRIQELNDTWDYKHIGRITPYGYDIEYRSTTNARDNAGWIAIEKQYLRMGENPPARWDGYIVYQVPKEATPEDIQIIADFDTFGNALWQLQ